MFLTIYSVMSIKNMAFDNEHDTTVKQQFNKQTSVYYLIVEGSLETGKSRTPLCIF